MVAIRKEVGDDDVWDGIDDVKNTSKIGVSKVRVVGRGFVVFGFSVVDLGNNLCFRRLI